MAVANRKVASAVLAVLLLKILKKNIDAITRKTTKATATIKTVIAKISV
jgi:hypothetical protein